MFGIFNRGHKIKGTVVLMSKNVLDYNEIASTTRGGLMGVAGGVFGLATDIAGGIVDASTAIFSRNISLQLISATKADELGNGKLGKQTFLEKHLPTLPTLGDRQDAFNIYFEWDESFGIPGAFYIKNFTQSEFFLVSVKLEDIPNHGTIDFVCNSWIYNAKKCYKSDRIFFANKTYLPDETPAPLVKYRNEELGNLRGDGKGKRKEYDRIYDYEVYNDLGNPDENGDLVRPILGGSSEHPYPRRVRTGRKATTKDPNSEKPSSKTYYIPRDENFGHLKSSDFLTYGIKAITQNVLPRFQSAFGSNAEFESFEDVRGLYEGGLCLPTDIISNISSIPAVKEIFRTDGEQFLKFPPPQVIRVSKSAWMTDEEFGREMLAGVNPGMIQCLQEFPPKSKLDATQFGDQTSTITKEQLEINLGGLTVEQALNDKRLFILDHHDAFMLYMRQINGLPTAKSYATRTILFLKDDGTLKPLTIELSLPHPRGNEFGALSRVVLPANEGAESTIWLLAKAYVVVNDSGYHQLISHWLNTHATIEPFVIATNRNLSVLHPIYKLLLPHYRDTMNINALARQKLINAGGTIEQSFLPGKFSMEMSSAVYKSWVFTDQALPADLIKRGMAVVDPSSPNGLRLVIEDYPYAVDGLEIWSAIKTWVQDYVSVYYVTDDAVKKDSELQAWWKEAVEKGHGDLKDKPWWPKLQTLQELIHTCSIIIWIASALHAAVNFGQYPYGGYILNRPTLTRRLLPEVGSEEYEECGKHPQKAYLRTITAKYQALVDLSVIEILSRHASDEVYLGQRDNNWTSDPRAIEAFKKFGKVLKEIEAKISERNKNPRLRNRNGPVQMPYTLLHPTSKEGLTCSGIPNSISI
ncbi:linoleate 9S-lipoxygenase 1 [Cajanus cajan]|uniref:Lipoxygenase n=1 Tax=Cajanus cajan TaxID=3821 RepID=A0A151T9G2_CAJCA|nr:linoleate 9S-lipoxygenase 1 [Cajanus cajan]KYP63644.1 Lipoxygenase 1 [Cajanus cajan]